MRYFYVVHPVRAVLWLVACVLVALGALFSGCTPRTVTREVYVRIPAPPPSVETRTDTLRAETAPDTVFVPRVLTVPGEARLVTRTDTVTRTVPAVVIRYATPRRARGFELLGLDVSADTLRVAGLARDWQFRTPHLGETLSIEALGPDSLAAAVRGAPRAVGLAVQVACPEEPRPIVPAGTRGWLRLAAWLLAAAAGGSILTALALSLRPVMATPAPLWSSQLDDLVAAFPTFADLAAALKVSTAGLARWRDGATPGSRSQTAISLLHASVRPSLIIAQQAALVRQALDNILEMDTLLACHTEARRVRDILRKGITLGPSGRPLWPPPSPVHLVTFD